MYQSNRYITDRFFPDKTIDILDEAAAKVKLRRVADTQNLRNCFDVTPAMGNQQEGTIRATMEAHRFTHVRNDHVRCDQEKRTRPAANSRLHRT